MAETIRPPPLKALADKLPKMFLSWLRDLVDAVNETDGNDYSWTNNEGDTVTVVNGRITDVS